MTRKNERERFSPIGSGKAFAISDLVQHYNKARGWGTDLLKKGLRFFPHGSEYLTTENLFERFIESEAITWEEFDDGRKSESA